MRALKLVGIGILLAAVAPPAVNFVRAGGYAILGKPAAVGTCDVTTVGAMMQQGGGSSTTRTRVCICGSDGAVTPVYAWCSLALTQAASVVCTGGTTTACP